MPLLVMGYECQVTSPMSFATSTISVHLIPFRVGVKK